MQVWLITHGDYDRTVAGVADSLDAAIAFIKSRHSAPYIVEWREPVKHTYQDDFWWELTGEFSRVQGYSTAHVGSFDISPYQVVSLLANGRMPSPCESALATDEQHAVVDPQEQRTSDKSRTAQISEIPRI